jgi:hypothetical protein
MEPAGAGLVAAHPGVRVDDQRRRHGAGGEGGGDAPDFRTVSGVRPGSAGGGWPGEPGAAPGCRCGRAEASGGDGAGGQGGHDQHEVALDGGVETGLAPVQAEAVLGELETFLRRPAQPRGPDQPGLRQDLADRDGRGRTGAPCQDCSWWVSGPAAAPGVRFSPHRALHVPCPLGLAGCLDRLGCPWGRYLAAAVA